MEPSRADRVVAEDARLSEALDAALAPFRGPGPPYALLFSGGIDSSVLAWELRHSPRLRLVTVGLPGSHDLAAARSAVGVLGIPGGPHELSGPELSELLRTLPDELDGVSGPARAVLVGLAAAIRAAGPQEVLCGQGADELFLGYAHFRGLDRASASARADADLAKLVATDLPRAERVAAALGHVLRAPYLHPEFVRAARAVPVADRRPSPEPKGRFRAWALGRGLPPELATRPKKALQYGTGLARWLERAETEPVDR